MNSIENKTQSAVRKETTVVPEKVTPKQERTFEIVDEPKKVDELVYDRVEAEVNVAETTVFKPESTETKIRRSFFDKYVDKIKEFLDNAE